MPDALKLADQVLQQAVRGITDLINEPGEINMDFADVQTVMRDKGMAHIGIGTATGDDKCQEAMRQAISSPLLETTIDGASHVLVNISGDVSLIEANDAVEYVREMADPNANIIFGTAYRETAADEVTITVIATGVKDAVQKAAAPIPEKKEQKAPNFANLNLLGGQRPPKAPAPEPQKLPENEDIKLPDFSSYSQRPRRDEQTIKIPDFLKKTSR